MRLRLTDFRSCAWVPRISLIIAAAIASPSAAWAQDDGARLYMMVPAGTTIMSMRLHDLNSNLSVDDATVSEGNDLHTKLIVFQFVQALRLAGGQSFIFLVVPASQLHTNANPAGMPDSIAGLGDVQLGFVLGVHGTPSLAAADYAEHKPGLAVNLLGKIFFPSGDYNAHRSINIGANRWALRLGIPLVYAIGRRMADPHLMTVEFMPTVTYFGPNRDPFGASRTQQKPLFILESHLTRGFTHNFWASLDLLWRRGGEMRVDGIGANNPQRALSLGLTGVLALPHNASLRLSYGRVVDRNAHGPNGSMLRAIIGFAF